MKNLSEMNLALASDHAGFALKQKVIAWLEAQGAKTHDFGCYNTDSCDYPDFAHPLAEAVEKGQFDFGIVICSTGNGICITANKHQGIRAALCWDTPLAELARQHNNANVLGLPANFISSVMALDIVRTFFQTDFEGGRHERRVSKIALH
jgi:ribose 5-phosphate isomerase B